jgi:hypothetical protein
VLVNVGTDEYRLWVAEYEPLSIEMVRALSAVHCAYSVKFAVWPWAKGKLIALPPLEAMNHPAKAKPARVGVLGELIDEPVVVEASAIALPPCSLVLTVNVLAVHTAYRVTLALIAKVLAADRDVPPHAAPAEGCVVHQPAKV